MPRGACPFSPGRAWPLKGWTRRRRGLPPSMGRRGRVQTGRAGRHFDRGKGGAPQGNGGVGQVDLRRGSALPTKRGTRLRPEGGVPESDETRGPGYTLGREVPNPRRGWDHSDAPELAEGPPDEFENKATEGSRAASMQRNRRHPPVVLQADLWGWSLLGPDLFRVPGITPTRPTDIPWGRSLLGPENNRAPGITSGCATGRTQGRSMPGPELNQAPGVIAPGNAYALEGGSREPLGSPELNQIPGDRLPPFHILTDPCLAQFSWNPTDGQIMVSRSPFFFWDGFFQPSVEATGWG
jgi:hypothetical protein